MATPRWLNDAEMKAWLGLIATSQELLKTIERDLDPFGIDGGDYQLLAMLSDAPNNKMKMCELAETLHLSRGGLTRRMDGVLKAKYVERVKDEKDGRATFAHLTDKGYSFLKKIAPSHLLSVRSRMINLLTGAEIKALGSAFSKIQTHLRSPE